jgi:hypothetical protein
MANIALIRGAAMAAPQYTSWKDALQEGLKDYKNFRNAQAIRLERERIAYQKVMQERNKELASDFKNMTNFDPAGAPNEYRPYFTQKLDAYRNMYAQAAKEYAGDPRKSIVLNDINLKVASLKDIMDTAKQAKLDYIDRERTTRDDGKGGVVTMPTTNSKANDSFTMQLDKLRGTGDFKIMDDKDGNPVAVFNAEQFPEETVANYAEKADEDGNPIFDKQTGNLIIPIGKLYSEYIPFQTQTKRYKETMQKVHDEIIPKLAKERFDRSFVDDKVNSVIDSLELTDEEKLSIAVDELGFETEEYAGGILFYKKDKEGAIVDTIEDENDNGVYDELDKFIKDSFKIGVEETWNKYNGHYAKKDDVDEPTKEEKTFEDVKSLASSLSELTESAVGMGPLQEPIDLVNAIKDIPAFATSTVESPAARKQIVIELLKKEGLSDKEASAIAEERIGNALLYIDKNPINDLKALLTFYNNSLPSARRLSNSELQQIINETTVDWSSPK